MLDFENHLIEGLSIGGKVSVKAKAKTPVKASARAVARPVVPARPAPARPAPTPARPVVRVSAPAPKAQVSGGLGGKIVAAIQKAENKAKPPVFSIKAAAAGQAKAKAAANTIQAKAALSVPKSPVLSAKAAASIPSIAAKIASPAFKAATPQIQAKVNTMLKASPAIKQAVAAHLALPATLKASPAIRQAVASNLAVKAITSLAKKPASIAAAAKAALRPNVNLAAKAVEAITPIAHACGCHPQPVITRVKAKMACKGYPPDSVDGLLGTLHDMNTSLEKAAIQRLATYEHNKLESKHNFEHEVLSQLRRLACKLPKCHPVRTKAHLAILRKA